VHEFEVELQTDALHSRKLFSSSFVGQQ